MVLQYSNQETSVTIGESVRDEDGMIETHFLPTAHLAQAQEPHLLRAMTDFLSF